MKSGHRVSIPSFIYIKTPLFAMVFRVRGVFRTNLNGRLRRSVQKVLRRLQERRR